MGAGGRAAEAGSQISRSISEEQFSFIQFLTESKNVLQTRSGPISESREVRSKISCDATESNPHPNRIRNGKICKILTRNSDSPIRARLWRARVSQLTRGKILQTDLASNPRVTLTDAGRPFCAAKR